MKEKTKTLSILTLNVGLLDVKLFGRSILEPAPFVRERLMALPKALIRTGADVIALQEVYEQEQRLFLIKELHKIYPHHFYSRQQKLFRLENSLIIFSKFPILHRKVLEYKNSIFEEELLAYKGVLAAKIGVPGWRPVTFYNFHTVAGGIRDPENKSVEAARCKQIHEIMQCILRGKGIKIVLGDLNAGAEADKANYDIFGSYGFADALFCKHRLSYKKKTWNPRNALNLGGPHKNCPPQVCDHIFFRKENLKHFRIDKAEVVLDLPLVKTPSGKRVTISDHAGVLARISKF